MDRAYSTLYLIEILHQTTTVPERGGRKVLLYLIEILHQTTTCYYSCLRRVALYLIEILHQTTTIAAKSELLSRCILLKFYIKPQRKAEL